MNPEPFYIVNPHSSNGKTEKIWQALIKRSADRSNRIVYESTHHSMHAASIASKALDSGYDTIVAVGGDGTVNEVLNGFYRNGLPINRNARLGFLPSGTGGDLARTLGLLDFSMEELIDELPLCPVFKLDHGVASFHGADKSRVKRFFLNEASVGFSADTVRAVNRSTKLLGGKVSFLLGVLRCLIGYQNQSLEISIDGNSWYSGPAFLVAVSNGKYFGGSMKIAPHAKMTDGMFDIVLIKSLTRIEVIRNIGKIYAGEHLGLRQIVSTRGKSVRITSHHPVPIEMDGEQPGTVEAHFEIVSKGVNFLIPHGKGLIH